MRFSGLYPISLALVAAALFGMSTPLAKVLLGGAGPVTLAGLLYLGSGLGLALFMAVRRAATGAREEDAAITRDDLPWLGAAVLAGGVAAPIVLMASLTVTPAATASLLLNTEAAATALIAVLLFGEYMGRRTWAALVCISAGGVLLAFTGEGMWGIAPGALGVILACILWGMDNNFTCRIAAKDPLPITLIKGLVAGSVSLLLAAAVGEGLPPLPLIGGALLLGFVSYGLSIVLYIISLRQVGAARTGAAFATAPFLGMLFSFIIFREAPGTLFFVSIPLMVIGALLLIREGHCHLHIHRDPGTGALTVHAHPHVHDAHHRHAHNEGEEPEEQTQRDEKS
jgi:drug/metabolite transporter (DMT)-like permease